MSLFTAGALTLSVGGASVAASNDSLTPRSVVATAPDDVTVPTVSDFYPEDSNLSDCIGLVEKPGCGSKARGGWRQATVFIVLVAGLGIVFGNVIRGVRKNRAELDPARPSQPVD